jgi:hypothetical protein
MPGAVKFQISLGNNISDIASVSYTDYTWQELVVTTATTDQAFNFGGVTTASVLYVKSDQAITLNLNSNTGTDISVLANKPFVLSGTAITAAYVSNASGSSANISFGVWGV